jgi:hypothetical protein
MTNEYVLIDRILAGEQQLYAELVNRYKSYAFTIALKILEIRPEAEEAAQDAFIKAYHSWQVLIARLNFLPGCTGSRLILPLAISENGKALIKVLKMLL